MPTQFIALASAPVVQALTYGQILSALVPQAHTYGQMLSAPVLQVLTYVQMSSAPVLQALTYGQMLSALVLHADVMGRHLSTVMGRCSTFYQGKLTNNRYMKHEFKLKFSTLLESYEVTYTENSKKFNITV